VLAIPGTQYAGDVSLAAEKHIPADCLRLLEERITDLRHGRVYTGHIPYSTEVASWLHKHAIKHLFIYRDPRDYTVSLCHYVMKKHTMQEGSPRHAYHQMFSGLGSDTARLLGTIVGIGPGQTQYRLSSSSLPNVRLMYEAYLGWITDENTFALRYEDLVGDAGQPSEKTAGTIMDILNYLDASCKTHDTALIDSILTRGMDPTKSRTFRRGGSGAWREEYTQQHLNAFQQIAGDLLVRLGYTRK
jgi:hypothetical protein